MKKFIKTGISSLMLISSFALFSCEEPVLPFAGKTLSAGQVGIEYSDTIANGNKDMYYDLDYDSNLPKGLILYDNGIIKGVPRESGTFQFKAVMIDLKDVEYYADFSLTIAGGELTFTGTTLPEAKQNEPYQQSIATATGMSSIQYEVKEGSSLPTGLSLSKDGVLSGIPSVYGDFTFIVLAKAEGCDDKEASFTLIITKGEDINNNEGKIVFEDFTLPDATVGQAYSESIRKAYGVDNITYKFRFSSGKGLPAGLSTNRDLGLISGTPKDSSEGVITFKVTASAPGYEDVTVNVLLTVFDPYVTTTTFETEYVDTIPHLSGAGYSSAPSGKGMIQSTPLCSNGHVLGYLNKPVEIKYTIHADSDTTGKLTLGLGSDSGSVTYDPTMFSIKVNGTAIDYGTLTFEQIGTSEATYKSTALPIANSISLKSGDNEVTFNVLATSKATGTYTAVGCLFDYIKIEDATCDIGWRPRTGNVTA